MKQRSLFSRHHYTPTMPFGKHVGERLSVINAGYLVWLLEQDWLFPDLREDIEAEMERRRDLMDARLEREMASWSEVESCPARCLTVLGTCLSGWESEVYGAAIEYGWLLIGPEMPYASPLPATWARQCQAEGWTHRTIEVGWNRWRDVSEYMDTTA